MKSSGPDADAILKTFELTRGVYLLGSQERGLTVYSQQARALNLAWALTQRLPKRRIRIAVIGGGIAGMTAAAAIASATSDKKVEICLLERRAHLCPLQLGCDTRFLHPKIYEWPHADSRGPSASWPVLNWEAARASDVARRIVDAFARGRKVIANDSRFGASMRVYLEVEHLTINSKSRKVEWLGRLDGEEGVAFPQGQQEEFDSVIVAAGFGSEEQIGKSATPSYWRNESFGQPILDGRSHTYAISGYGDGALIDLARLTIDRFRQDRIIDELFGADPADDVRLSSEISALKPCDSFLPLLQTLERTLLGKMIPQIRMRLRTDVKVAVYLGGGDGKNTSIAQVFGGKVSFINRVLFYSLFRCGAFVPVFRDLDAWKAANGVLPDRFVVRHGTNTVRHLSMLFSDLTDLMPRLEELRTQQAQLPKSVFPIRSFYPIFGD